MNNYVEKCVLSQYLPYWRDNKGLSYSYAYRENRAGGLGKREKAPSYSWLSSIERFQCEWFPTLIQFIMKALKCKTLSAEFLYYTHCTCILCWRSLTYLLFVLCKRFLRWRPLPTFNATSMIANGRLASWKPLEFSDTTLLSSICRTHAVRWR